MNNTEALAKLNTPKPSGPTLYEELWQKLDGAYARWRRHRAMEKAGTLKAGVSLRQMEGRVTGLVEAVAIMSRGVMDEDAVKAETLRRWKDRQGLDKTNGREDA